MLLVPALAVAAIGLRNSGSDLDLAGWAAFTATPLAWIGSALLLTSWILIFFAFLGTVGSNGTPTLDPDSPDGTVQTFADDSPTGLGICVSGGGIRAGSVAMGALREFEQSRVIRNAQRQLIVRSLDDQIAIQLAAAQGQPDFDAKKIEHETRKGWSKRGEGSVLDMARYLASVSGGGYTAVAYQIARGATAKPLDDRRWDGGTIFGVSEDRGQLLPANAFDDPPSKRQHFSLRDHVLSRRKFLFAGRGGPLWSTLTNWCGYRYPASADIDRSVPHRLATGSAG